MNKTSENKVLKMTKNIEISKASFRDRFSGRFSRDGAEILSRPSSVAY